MSNFLWTMRKKLEEEKNLNKWIDLIFGVNQILYVSKAKKYKYYEESSELKFKNIKKYFDDPIKMDLIDFGVLPYQLFNRNFPTRIYKNKYNTKKEMLNELRKLNLNLFNEEHIGEIYSPLESFICKGRTLINNNYIKIIDPKEHLNILENFGVNNNYLTKIENSLNKIIFYKSFGNINLKKTEFYDSSIIDYYFVGDIFGTVFIYSLVEYKEPKDKEKEKEKEKNEKEDDVNKLFSLDSFEIINNGNKESLVYMESDQSKNKKEFYNLKGKENIIPITKVNKIVFTFQLKLIKKLNYYFK